MRSSRRAVLVAMATGMLATCTGSSGTADVAPSSLSSRSLRPRPLRRSPHSRSLHPRARRSPFVRPASPRASGTADRDGTPGAESGAEPRASRPAALPPTRAQVTARYAHREPRSWGLKGPKVMRTLPTERRVIALTFDACGGPGGNGYDRELIDFLRRKDIPATLFLNSRWIDANPAAVRRLAREPLFELANHGTRHRPLSVTGRSAYGIAGTRDVGEAYDEIVGNQIRLARLLDAPPRFFRSGTAYCDDVAACIVGDLGQRFVGFSVNGDGGATLSPEGVRRAVASARGGSIVIGHMNHPGRGTARGIAAAVPQLQARGYGFVRLSDELR